MSKKFYWIKLKTEFFSIDEIDFILSQNNGCEYVVLYQMLCLMTANNNGELCRQIGEMLVPYDVDKIVRETKYFDYDTVVVALELFKKLGLIYEQDNGILKITHYDNMVGSETDKAAIMRARRERQKQLPDNNQEPIPLPNCESDAVTTETLPFDDNTEVTTALLNGNNEVTMLPDCGNNEVTMLGRDKSIEIRDKDIDINLYKESKEKKNHTHTPSEQKKSYGEYGWIKLTDEEYAHLISDLKESELNRCIKYIDESAQTTGNKNKWKDWNLVIRRCSRYGWGKSEADKDMEQSPSSIDMEIAYNRADALPQYERCSG